MKIKSTEEKIYNKALGQKIKAVRLAMGFSQGEFGKIAGCTYQQIQKYESGVNAPSIYRMKNICELIDCDFDKLIFGESSLRKNRQSSDIVRLLNKQPEHVSVSIIKLLKVL